LKANACDEAQGYYFSRPVPPAQFAALVESATSKRGTARVA
jgi:EAL domain-containing protein (putative c-di-GMP-specific phosphodiesterase class I)